MPRRCRGSCLKSAGAWKGLLEQVPQSGCVRRCPLGASRELSPLAPTTRKLKALRVSPNEVNGRNGAALSLCKCLILHRLLADIGVTRRRPARSNCRLHRLLFAPPLDRGGNAQAFAIFC